MSDAGRYPQMNLSAIDGEVLFSHSATGVVTAERRGGNIVGVSTELLMNGEPVLVTRVDDDVKLLQYKARIIGVGGDPPHTYFVELTN